VPVGHINGAEKKKQSSDSLGGRGGAGEDAVRGERISSALPILFCSIADGGCSCELIRWCFVFPQNPLNPFGFPLPPPRCFCARPHRDLFQCFTYKYALQAVLSDGSKGTLSSALDVLLPTPGMIDAQLLLDQMAPTPPHYRQGTLYFLFLLCALASACMASHAMITRVVGNSCHEIVRLNLSPETD